MKKLLVLLVAVIMLASCEEADVTPNKVEYDVITLDYIGYTKNQVKIALEKYDNMYLDVELASTMDHYNALIYQNSETEAMSWFYFNDEGTVRKMYFTLPHYVMTYDELIENLNELYTLQTDDHNVWIRYEGNDFSYYLPYESDIPGIAILTVYASGEDIY